MKNFVHFQSRKDQLDYIWDSLITVPDFQNNPFYRGLVEWVVENRAPFFFYPSQPYEYAHFSQYWQGILIRDNYDNPYVQSLYYLHDFVHNLFYATFQPRKIPMDSWSKIIKGNERVASNETEIRVYYRIPELRRKTFDYPIMFDKISQWSPNMPSVQDLVDLRYAMANQDFIWNLFFSAEERKQWHKSIYYHTGHTPKHWAWRGLWYAEFPELQRERRLASLSYDTYEAVLPTFVSGNDALWRSNYSKTVQCAVELATGRVDELAFEDCKEALNSLNNTVIMNHAAKEYHIFYSAYL